MDDVMNVIKVGLGTLVALLLVGGLMVLFVRDVTQKKHTVLRNFPIVGHFRYWFEELGEYFRQYFFAGDRDEMPFNRSTRARIRSARIGTSTSRRWMNCSTASRRCAS